MIETSSAYLLIPCTFTFVLNLRPSSFAQANSSDRAMIFMLPVMTLLFRALVICQRVVDMTSADQKQLYVSSMFTCFIAAVLSMYFDPARDEPQSGPLFASDTSPQYIVVALLVVQVITQTVVRRRAAEESIFDNTDWLWSSRRSHASAQISFDELPARLVMGSVRSVAFKVLDAAMVAGKFVLLNYLAISQLAMAIAGLASSGPTSPPSIESSSVIIGCIPLIISGTLLLYNTAKFIRFLWQLCWKKAKQTGPRRSDRDSLY